MIGHEQLTWIIAKHLEEIAYDGENYEGSKYSCDNEAKIFDTAMKLGIVDQDWFDNRLKATPVELLCELLYVVGLHHMKETIQKSLQD